MAAHTPPTEEPRRPYLRTLGISGAARSERTRPLRHGPPSSHLPNQQPLPASLLTNHHAPRRIALGGVWEGGLNDGCINQ